MLKINKLVVVRNKYVIFAVVTIQYGVRMNKKESVLLFALSLAFYFGLMILRAYGPRWAEIAHSIAFFFLTFWALCKYAPKAGVWRVLLLVFLPWTFDIVTRILFPSSTLLSLPITVLPIFAIVTAALFYHYRKVWLLVACCLLWLFGVTEGHSQWTEWVRFHKAQVPGVCLGSYEVCDSTHSFKLSDLPKEYVVLDVWSSTCGVCINEMPEVQALHDKYKDNERVEISTLMVFVRQGETVSKGYSIMEKRGCDMPVYGIDQKSQLLKDCKIERFPHVLILDKERNVIFNGSRQFAERKLKELI